VTEPWTGYAKPYERHCGTGPSGSALRVEVYDFEGAIVAWAIRGVANPEDPSGRLLYDHESAIAADHDRKSTEPRDARTVNVLKLLVELCTECVEESGPETRGDWSALAALAEATSVSVAEAALVSALARGPHVFPAPGMEQPLFPGIIYKDEQKP